MTVAKKASPASWNGQTRGGRFGNGFLKAVLKIFGLRAGYFFLLFVVPYFYLFAPKARRAAHEYWRRIKPKSGPLRRRLQILKQMFCFGQVLMDRAYQSFQTETQFQTRPHGLENILAPLKKDGRLILQTAHMGSWDLATRFLNVDGYAGRFHMVHYEFAGLTFDKAAGVSREAFVESVPINRQPILEVKQLLEAGEPVGFMGDRAGGTHYELVSFLGGLAPFDARPLRIAAALQCPLVNTFGFKDGTRSYSLFASPSRQFRYTDSKPRALQLLDWVQTYAQDLESLLRRYPTQWFNFFPFFSTVPSQPPGVPTATERHHLLAMWPRPTRPISAWVPDPTTNGAPEFPS